MQSKKLNNNSCSNGPALTVNSTNFNNLHFQSEGYMQVKTIEHNKPDVTHSMIHHKKVAPNYITLNTM